MERGIGEYSICLGGPRQIIPRIRLIRRSCGRMVKMTPTQWQADDRKALRKYRIEDILRPSYNDVVPEVFHARIPSLTQALKADINARLQLLVTLPIRTAIHRLVDWIARYEAPHVPAVLHAQPQ